MFGKTIKIILAIVFIPIVIASTKAFFRTLDDLNLLSINLFLLVGGFFSYPIFHIVFLKPMYIYAIGHEIVHVLATWICGGKVTSFNISQNGGNVTTTKTNLFIRLSPYFVPIHTITLILFFWIISRFYNITGFANELMFLVGFTLSFHIFMTIEVMKMRQPDIVKTGYLFSVLFIYVANISVMLLTLSCIFKNISFIAFIKSTFIILKDIYLDFFNMVLK